MRNLVSFRTPPKFVLQFKGEHKMDAATGQFMLRYKLCRDNESRLKVAKSETLAYKELLHDLQVAYLSKSTKYKFTNNIMLYGRS